MNVRCLVWLIGLLLVSALNRVVSAQTNAKTSDTGKRIAVLITQWGEPEGFHDEYRKKVVDRSAGFKIEAPGEACTDLHVGKFPFAPFPGLLPFAVTHKVKGLEPVYDSYGFFRLSDDRQTYISVYDPSVRLAVKDLPGTPGLVKPATEFKRKPTRSLWCLDPRDGKNYCEGIFLIGEAGAGPGPNPLAFPNGIRDINEVSYIAAITDFNVLFADQTPRLSHAVQKINAQTKGTLEKLFGNRVDVRKGAYTAASGLMESEDQVAVDFAQAGFRQMVIARETTDNNNYANNFMSRGFVEKALCKAGFAGQMQFQQVRQVGRTPEYNVALMRLMKPHLDQLKPGSEVAVLYTTYGLPWPGRDAGGPFTTPHPWPKEVYHENAYNNYVAFKRYAESYFGRKYKLAFNRAGKSGDLRTDNYFSYGLILPNELAQKETELRFRTLRENIDAAKKEGRREILVVLSHWVDNNRDTLLAVRVMQKIPLNARGDFEKGKFWTDWCERVDSSDPVPCNSPDAVHLTYAEAFDKVADVFATGYAHRLRGGIERFGELPAGLNVKVIARGDIGREVGGVVEVTNGKLKGVRLEVAKDAHPGEPERFTFTEYKTFNDPADNLVSAWDDFSAYIGTQNVSPARLQARAQIVSDTVLMGPYRTLFNRPARVTIPLRQLKGVDPKNIRAFIYNEATGDWDQVYEVVSGSPLRVDDVGRTATFDVQTLGVFVLAIPKTISK